MRLRYVAGSDGHEAREPRLRCQQIVVRGIQPSGAVGIGQPIADGEEVTVAIVERGEPHAVSQGATTEAQLDQRIPGHGGRFARQPPQRGAQCPDRRQRRRRLELVNRDRLIVELGQQPIERVALLVEERGLEVSFAGLGQPLLHGLDDAGDGGRQRRRCGKGPRDRRQRCAHQLRGIVEAGAKRIASGRP
jgi:hypothetical protein